MAVHTNSNNFWKSIYTYLLFLQEATTKYLIDSFRRNGRMDVVKEEMEKMNKKRKLVQEHIPKTEESISV